MITRPRRFLLVLLVACIVSPAGCKVETVEGVTYVGPKNSCADGCPADTTCVDGSCRSARTSYPFFLEVTPPSVAPYAPSVTFTIPLPDQDSGTRNLSLPQIAHLTVRLETPLAADAQTNFTVRFHDANPDGTGATIEARSRASSDAGGRPFAELDLPPGVYDIILEPTSGATEGANLTNIPPLFVAGQPVDSGNHDIVVSLGSTRSFSVQLTDSLGAPLTRAEDGRDVAVVDQKSGRFVSTTDRTCDHPGRATLQLSPSTTGPIADSVYVLRISPPKKVCVAGLEPPPTADFNFAGLDIDGSGRTKIALPRPPASVTVDGDVRAYATREKITSKLLFTSRSLAAQDGAVGQLWLIRSADAVGGHFSASLPPGVYTLRITPDAVDAQASNFSVRNVDATISAATTLPLEVVRKAQTVGGFATATGTLFTLGTAQFSAVPPDTATAVQPRSQSAAFAVSVDSESPSTYWNIDTLLDPGSYDLTGRVPEASGYPWIVRPRWVLKTPTTADPRANCGTMRATPPVVLAGAVTDPTRQPVGRATVRAYGRIPATDGAQDRLLLVGEAKADDFGNYALMIPSAFDTGASGGVK